MPILVILCDVSPRYVTCQWCVPWFDKLVAGWGQVAGGFSSPEEMRNVINWYGVVTRELWSGYGMLELLEDPEEEGPADTLFAKKTRGPDRGEGWPNLVQGRYHCTP